MPVYLIDKIKQKNGKDFPLLDAADVLMPDGKRLDKAFEEAGGTSALPEVGEEDEGKVLKVVGGSWAAAAVPSAEEASF